LSKSAIVTSMSNQEAHMGLMDILNGMQQGPRGPSQPGGGSGGMSPMTMALLGLLAYKAVKSFSGSSAAGQDAPPSGTATGGLGGVLGRMFGGSTGPTAAGAPASSGSLSELVPAELGNLLGSGGAGTLISSGLGALVQELKDKGYGQEAQSWVGSGPNKEIAPNDLADALGPDTLDALSRQTGMKRDDLIAGLSQHLPNLVDQLTPEGRLPSEDEASRMG
jgi:uncharacterized protein YidB (DUF937 family)